MRGSESFFLFGRSNLPYCNSVSKPVTKQSREWLDHGVALGRFLGPPCISGAFTLHSLSFFSLGYRCRCCTSWPVLFITYRVLIPSGWTGDIYWLNKTWMRVDKSTFGVCEDLRWTTVNSPEKALIGPTWFLRTARTASLSCANAVDPRCCARAWRCLQRKR